MHRYVAAIAVPAVLVGVLTGCGADSAPQAGGASPSVNANSVHARCQAQEWPQPMPDVEGRTFEPLGKDLMCFDNIEAVAPDGRDVMSDPASGLGAWTVKSSTPGPGTRVRITTPITLELEKARGE
ncbi:hypothetical protein [Streptomyces sp. NPDC096324]|uniref:PASTA domain-containing protein n=1 Tax=Streptomyces sp. NPDC096324 TaxID=3366085 RepID=UPI00382A1B9B